MRKELLAALPALRAFALGMTGNRTDADNLVHDALLAAWARRDEIGSRRAPHLWPTIILRNAYFLRHRGGSHLGAASDGSATEVKPLTFSSLLHGLQLLPDSQREALLLLEGAKFSEVDAAIICDVSPAIVRKRATSARLRLAEFLLDANDEGIARAVARSHGRSGPTGRDAFSTRATDGWKRGRTPGIAISGGAPPAIAFEQPALEPAGKAGVAGDRGNGEYALSYGAEDMSSAVIRAKRT